MGPKVWETVMMGRDGKGKVQEKERGGRDKDTQTVVHNT